MLGPHLQGAHASPDGAGQGCAKVRCRGCTRVAEGSYTGRTQEGGCVVRDPRRPPETLHVIVTFCGKMNFVGVITWRMVVLGDYPG